MLRRPDAPLGPLRLAGRYRGAPRLRSSARRDAPSPAPGCSTGSRPARPAETPGPPRFLEDPPPCMPRSRTPARRWTPGRCGVPVLPSVVSRTSALATQCFEALSRGLHGPCVRFAAWIAPRPRNTRCRLVASLGRAGLVTRRVPPKGFRAMCYIPLPPSPGFAWRKLTKDLGSSVVVATIQSLMTDRRYREEFTPFYFDLVINDEAHRSIYGDAREVVQFFQATRIGLTATPKAYLKNVDLEELEAENPKALEARQLRDTYHYFGCAPGLPTFRYDIIDAVKDPEGPFLCLPKIFDLRSDITTQALAEGGWAVVVNEQDENFKIQDLERKIFTPARNRLMCEAFLHEAQKDPSGTIGKSIVFAVNQKHATNLTKIFNELQPGLAVTITSRIPDASTIAKEFRDNKRAERIAVSVDMLSTGYNCRDILNIGLMRPIFSPTEYIQIKGRGTRLFTFKIGTTEYEKKNFFLLDFCAVAEYFEEKYDYSQPLKIPRERQEPKLRPSGRGE